MSRNFITEENDYGELNTGETTLSSASHELGNSIFKGGYMSSSESDKPLGTEIALVTNEVSVAHPAALKNGASELKTPEEKPWGQAGSYVRWPLAIVHCPSGILLELCTPIVR